MKINNLKRWSILFLLFISVLTFAEKKSNGFYGDVKYCKTITLNAKSQFGQVVTLDTTGISERTYGVNGDDIGSRSWTPTLETVTIFELSADGKKQYGQKFSNAVLESEYWYNDKGLMVRLRSTYQTGALKGKTSDVRYAYNDFGKHLADTSYNEYGEMKHLTTYEYNKDSLLSVRTTYTENGSVLSLTKYYYDDNNREEMTAESLSYSDNKNYTKTEYDENGRKKTFSRISSNSANEYSYHYLDFGHDEYTTMFHKSTTKTSQTYTQTDYEYVYDDHGNWVKKITYNVNLGNDLKNATLVQIRQIEYF